MSTSSCSDMPIEESASSTELARVHRRMKQSGGYTLHRHASSYFDRSRVHRGVMDGLLIMDTGICIWPVPRVTMCVLARAFLKIPLILS